MGNGGYVAKQGIVAAASPTNVLNITEWSMQKSVRVTDATHSGTAGWALYKGSVKEASGSVKAFWDANALVESMLGIDAGTECTLVLKLGNSTKKFYAPALITDLSYQVNNQSGHVTYDFNWKCQGPVTGPR